MTREQAKQLLPIIEAFANGETVQYFNGSKWCDADICGFSDSKEKYRVKPKPREFTVFLAKDGTILHKSPNSDDRVSQGYLSFGIQAIRVREIIED